MSSLTQPHVPATTIQRHETGSGVDTRYLEIYALALDVKSEELLPTTNTLSEEERAILGIFNRMLPNERQTFLKLGRAMAEPEAPFDHSAKAKSQG